MQCRGGLDASAPLVEKCEDEKIQAGQKISHRHAGIDPGPLFRRSAGEFCQHTSPHCGRRRFRQGAQIICTQELFRSLYFCQSENHDFFKLAESIPGPTTDALQKAARRHKVVIVASLFEKRGSGVYHNTAAIIDADGSLLGIYRKMHIPDDPLYYEKFYFTPGDTGFRTWQTAYGKIGVLICCGTNGRSRSFQRRSDRVAGGAEILFYPTAIGWHPAKRKRITGPINTARGKSSSAATPSPMVVTSRPSTGSARKNRKAAPVWNSGAKVSSPAPPGKSLPKPAWKRKKRCSSPLTSAKVECHADALAVPARPPHRCLRTI